MRDGPARRILESRGESPTLVYPLVFEAVAMRAWFEGDVVGPAEFDAYFEKVREMAPERIVEFGPPIISTAARTTCPGASRETSSYTAPVSAESGLNRESKRFRGLPEVALIGAAMRPGDPPADRSPRSHPA